MVDNSLLLLATELKHAVELETNLCEKALLLCEGSLRESSFKALMQTPLSVWAVWILGQWAAADYPPTLHPFLILMAIYNRISIESTRLMNKDILGGCYRLLAAC